MTEKDRSSTGSLRLLSEVIGRRAMSETPSDRLGPRPAIYPNDDACPGSGHVQMVGVRRYGLHNECPVCHRQVYVHPNGNFTRHGYTKRRPSW